VHTALLQLPPSQALLRYTVAMASYTELTSDTATPQMVFQPEGLCARCAEREPVFDFVFTIKTTSLPNQTTTLGFCSEECLAAFVGGVEGARVMSIDVKEM
jgi:hypothetical protein